MVGTSNTSAPRSRNWRENWLACSRVRVTTMRWPNSGRFSNQFSFERSFTTSPITVTAGEEKFSAVASSAMSASVPAMDCCRPVVPQRTIATGVAAAIPFALRTSAMWPIRSAPIKMIFVPGAFASRSQSMSLSSLAGHDRKAGAIIAMGQRNAGIIWRRCDRRNAGHNFKRNFRRRKLLRLFAPTAKDVRVAAFEPDDGFAFLRFGDQQSVQFVLRDGVVVGAFAAVNNFNRLRGESQQIRIDQRVIDHNIGAREQFRA